MLPETKRLYEKPWVQEKPELMKIIRDLADWDKFIAMSKFDLAHQFGMLSGALLVAIEELEELDE